MEMARMLLSALAILKTFGTNGQVALVVPTGEYEGSVPFIIDITVDFTSATTVDFDINIKVKKQDVKCSAEAIAISDTQVSFPNIGKTGDCMGDALRGQNKDVSKYFLAINADGSLTFHSDGYPPMKLKEKSLALAAPTGEYEGSVPFIIDITADFTSATTVDLDINIKVKKQDVNCSAEAIAISAAQVSFPNIGKTGDCMGDALRGQNKDVSKYFLAINADGSLTFHSDGYPPMKLKKKSLALAAPTGEYEGSVPFIIDITADFTSATTVDFDINIKVKKQDVKCSAEAIAISAAQVSFPNIGKTGDCMGDALRGQNKDVSKYFLAINADGSLTFHSDGYPPMKLKKKSLVADVRAVYV